MSLDGLYSTPLILSQAKPGNSVSIAVRHGPARAPWMSTGPGGPIAATLDIDTGPLFCFGSSLAFSGCCIWETFPAKWLIHQLLLFGLRGSVAHFSVTCVCQGNTSTGLRSESHCPHFPPENHSILHILHRALTALEPPGPFKDFYFPIF